MDLHSTEGREQKPRLLTDDLRDCIALLKSQFGDRAVTNAGIRESHGHDESYHRAGTPDVVVFPHSTEEVADVVRLCTERRVPLIPFGAGTSLEGQVNAIAGGVSLDLTRMNRILRVGVEDFDCTVQAGVRRKQLNSHLRDTGLTFPIDPGPDATVGGMAATRASGTNAVKYGTMRENILSLQVVTSGGRIIQTARRARKSSAGYDLTRLFIGSEGTLGVITEVSLKLHGIPDSVIVGRCSFNSEKDAVNTAIQTLQAGVTPARVEFLDDRQMMAINRYSKLNLPPQSTLFFELHGSKASVEEQLGVLQAIASENRAVCFQEARERDERSALWQARHDAYYAAVSERPGAKGLATDVCVPISRIAECITETKRDLRQCPVPSCIVGHVGDGNFHVIFSLDTNNSTEMRQVSEVSHRMVERALAMDGTCTGEHGVGLGKMKYLSEEHGEALELMRVLKRSIDPFGIFNPGKVLDVEDAGFQP